MNVKIQLLSIEDVKKFVNIVSAYPFDIDLVSGRYTLDAKSIMGIFSLDLSKPITVSVDDNENGKELFEKIKDYII